MWVYRRGGAEVGRRCVDGGSFMRLWAGVTAKNWVKLHWLDW